LDYSSQHAAFSTRELNILSHEVSRLFGRGLTRFTPIPKDDNFGASGRVRSPSGEQFFVSLRPLAADVDVPKLKTTGRDSQVLVGFTFVEKVTHSEADYLLTVRPYEARMLSSSPLYTPRGYAKYQALSKKQATHRVRVIQDLVRGLMELHEEGVAHKDLRPTNVSMQRRGAALVDIGLGSRAEKLGEYQRRFIAPEVLDGQRETPKSDIYSMGEMLDQLLLGHFSQDDVVPMIGARAGAVRWLASAAKSADQSNRPTSNEMWDVLFGDSKASIFIANEVIERARRGLVDSIQSSGVKHHQAEQLALIAHQRIEHHLLGNPITSIALATEDRARALLALIPIEPLDLSIEILHNRSHNERSPLERVYVEKSNADIDDDWKRRIALDYVDTVRDLDDDATLEQVHGLLSKENAALYAYEVEFAGRVRDRLLRENEFFDADGLSRFMSQPKIPVVASDIDVLREWGLLFGVRDHGNWIYPQFQFDAETGAPFEIIEKIQAQVPANESPWASLSWWCTPNGLLEGLAPSDLLGHEGAETALLSAIDSAIR